jgi:predicted transcriptional regulator
MKKLTQKEEEIMGYFWTHGQMFVRELLDLQDEPKPHYNTLSTIVRRLEEKGYIGYKAYGNTYCYHALISEDEYRKSTLDNVVNRYFGNSYTRVVSTLIKEEKLSVDELQKLIQMIKNKPQEHVLWDIFCYTY